MCKEMISMEQLPAQTGSTELAAVVNDVLGPMMKTIAQMMAQNAEALQRLAAAQKLQSDRMDALEKAVRLNTPVTSTQAKLLNDACKSKARAMLEQFGLADDRRAVNRLCGMIRKAVYTHYGINSMRDIPKHEYSVAQSQIELWSNMIQLRDVVLEAQNAQSKC